MRNQQKTNKRNKIPDNKDGWCLHPTKGWKRVFKLQRLHERFLNERAAARVKGLYGVTI